MAARKVYTVNTSTTLSQLVEQAAIRHSDAAGKPASGRRLAGIAQAHGLQVTATPLTEIRSGKYKSVPSPHLLRTIAWLAGVPESVAFTAANQPTPGPPFADDLPEGVDHLSPRSRKAAIDILRALVQAEAGNSGQEDQPQAGPEPDPDPIPFRPRGDAVDDGAVAGQEDEADWAASKTRGPRDLDVFDAEHGGAGEHDQRNHEDD